MGCTCSFLATEYFFNLSFSQQSNEKELLVERHSYDWQGAVCRWAFLAQDKLEPGNWCGTQVVDTSVLMWKGSNTSHMGLECILFIPLKWYLDIWSTGLQLHFQECNRVVNRRNSVYTVHPFCYRVWLLSHTYQKLPHSCYYTVNPVSYDHNANNYSLWQCLYTTTVMQITIHYGNVYIHNRFYYYKIVN